MTITDQQRDTSFAVATEQQKFLYASPESGALLRGIANKNAITDKDQYRDFAITVGDVILGLQSRAELPTLLNATLGITTQQAVKITADLIDFFDTKKPTPLEDTASDVSKIEPAPAPKEITYSSTQEAILKEGGSHTIKDLI